MLTTIPPWVAFGPNDFLNAASQGAHIGLARAQMANEADEAAKRLQFGYAQLASENARAAAAQSGENARANAAMSLHAAGLQEEAQRHADERTASQQLNDYRGNELKLETNKFNAARTDKQNLLNETSSLFNELSQSQNPQDQMKALAKHPTAAEALKSGVLSDFVQKPVQPTGAEKLTDAILSTEQKANEAFARGDTTAATQLRDRAALLREQTKGQEIVTGYDDQGRPIIKMGKGVAGSPTVATQSQAQQKLIRYENTVELMNHLDQNLAAGHLGVAGLAGEWLMDRGLSQLVPELVNKDRVDARSTLIALREGLAREMADDRSRFSAADREEIMRALPSNGAFESLPDAQQRINTVRQIIMQRARNYSQALGQTPPLWTMSADEIRDLFRKGKIDENTAANALERFH